MVPKILSPDVPLPRGDHFQIFMEEGDNKIEIRQMLETYLIEKAPCGKTIVVSPAYEDPLDV